MNILFTHSYVLALDPKQKRAGRPYAPLGTLYAAAMARSLGHAVEIHDPQFDTSEQELLAAIKNNKPDLLVFWDDGFNYLTKMCLSNMRGFVLKTLQDLPDKNIPVWINSSDSSDHPEIYLDAGADCILLGEGEETLADMLQHFPERYKLQGLVSRFGKMPSRPVLRNPDALPVPDYTLINMEKYRNAWIQNHGYFSINIVTTRGCPFSCNWCAKPIYGNRYNAHSPAYIVAQIKNLVSSFGINHIWFADDIFGLKPGWVQEFSELMSKENLALPFTIQSRVDLLLKGDTALCLAKAGCKMVWVGAESGSQKILDAMDKGTRVEQIAEATHLLHAYGIEVAYFLQFGYPGEQWEDIQLTLEMVEKNRPDDIGVSVSYPLPGTVFYEKVKNEMTEKNRWSDSDDLTLMFHHTYPPVFYKALHRYLHKKFRKNQALLKINHIGGALTHPTQFLSSFLRFCYYMLVTPWFKFRWYVYR